MDRFKNVAVILVMCLVAGVGLWFKQRPKDEKLREATGAVSTKQVAAARTKFQDALNRATADWKAERYLSAALILYHAYPSYENALNSQGFAEVAKGTTYRDEFESSRAAFVTEIMEKYPAIVARIKTGDFAMDDMGKLTTHLPFPFGRELNQKWRADRDEVERARRENAAGWFLIFVSGPEGTHIGHAGAIRDALQKKWREGGGLKLVFDKPGGLERIIGRYLFVNFSETNVTYEFAKSQNHRGGGAVPEEVKVTFQATVPPGGKIRTNWDSLPPLKVRYSAPEKLQFRFKNARQGADFDSVIADQRAQLTQKLASELEKSIPLLEIAIAR